MYVGLLVLALGAPTSTALCGVGLAIIVPAGLCVSILEFRQKGWAAIPSHAWPLVGLGLAGVISCGLNFDTIERPFHFAFKTKYWFLGALGVVAAKHFLVWLSTRRRETATLLGVAAGALGVTTAYGVYVAYSGHEFLGLHPHLATPRNQGFTDVMRHSHTSLYLFVLFAWCLRWGAATHFLGSRRLLWCGLIAGVVGLISGGSRGALCGLLLSLPFLWGNGRRYVWMICIAAVSFFLFLNLSGNNPLLPGRTFNPDRLAMWRLAWLAAKEKPFFGHGVRQFERQAPRLETEHAATAPAWIATPQKIRGMSHAHNNLLQLLADYGVIGLSCYLLWLALLLKAAWRHSRALFCGVAAFVTAFSVAGLSQYVFDTQGSTMIVVLLMLSSAATQIPSLRWGEGSPQR